MMARGGKRAGCGPKDSWSDKDKERLAKLWNEGRTAPELADLFGRKISAVNGMVYRLRKAGVALRCKETTPTTRTSSDPEYIEKPDWDGADKHRCEALQRLWAMGLSVKEIAAKIKVSERAIMRRKDLLRFHGVDLMVRNHAMVQRKGFKRSDFEDPTLAVPLPIGVKNIPLIKRQRFECSWITSEDGAEETTCCGLDVPLDGGVQFCVYHRHRARGAGTEGEQRALRDLVRMLKKEAA